MIFDRKIVRHFDDVLDWSPVRKSILILGMLTVIVTYYWSFQLYQTFFPSIYINYENFISLRWGVPFLFFATFALILLGKRIESRSWAQKVFPYIATFYYATVLVVLGYLIGLFNMTTGLVMAGAPLFGFVLFRRRIIYAAFGFATVLILALSVLSSYGHLAYGPLFKPEFYYHQEARPFYLMCMVYFALPHFILIFGFCDLCLIRWRQREREIHKISITDDLTGLLNRRAINNLLQVSLTQNTGPLSPVSVILLDIDLFKKINDIHGHLIGDKALQAVSATLQSTLRKDDQVGRYGGEEFLIVLNQTELKQAVTIAERCRVAISEVYISDEQDQRLQITASFGVSCSQQCGYQTEKIIRQADRYLYQAKDQGRNQVVSILNTSVPMT
ncbi:GGDEF domain-containing protein [Alkanindiges sp. WGS2144]|uniref:GGDEF domain-containing protein n=1 Tax=Alkanindiges sp. WGS2144 TaxID=3366808 RepID=UPI003753D64F